MSYEAILDIEPLPAIIYIYRTTAATPNTDGIRQMGMTEARAKGKIIAKLVGLGVMPGGIIDVVDAMCRTAGEARGQGTPVSYAEMAQLMGLA